MKAKELQDHQVHLKTENLESNSFYENNNML